MTDFTSEEMQAIILRSLNANAARMRRKLKRREASAAAKAARAAATISGNASKSRPAAEIMARGRSGE